jgi:xylulokinase
MALYLGFDSSTQSLTAIAIEVDGGLRRIVHHETLAFDEELPDYGTRHGVTVYSDPAIGVAPPLMWVEALDRMMDRLSTRGIDWSRLAAISGSAQQHGSVYLTPSAARLLEHLDPRERLVGQVRAMLARDESPIWMDSSTTVQCAEIAAAVGGDEVLARRTGSRAIERFTGAQIRKFWQQDPWGYEATGRIHLVSSFAASLLAGRHAPLDPGDASGMNLMDLATSQWWPAAVPRSCRRLSIPGARWAHWRRTGSSDTDFPRRR